MSDWEPYLKNGIKSSSSLSFDMIEHVLFRLVWNTINDLSVIREVYNNSFVQTVLVSGGSASISKSTPLLHLLCKDLLSIKYEAGFDNMHHYHKKNGEFVRVKINPENCRVKIILKKDKDTKILI